MVIIRYTGKVFIITQQEGFTGKWLHLWLVISKKAFHLGKGLGSPFVVVDDRYFLSYITIDIFDTVIDLFFPVLQQMCLQKLNVLFHCWFTLWFTRGRWKDHYIVEVLEILIGTIDYQLILCMLGDCRF